MVKRRIEKRIGPAMFRSRGLSVVMVAILCVLRFARKAKDDNKKRPTLS